MMGLEEQPWVRLNIGFDVGVDIGSDYAQALHPYVDRIRRSKQWKQWWESTGLSPIWLFPVITTRQDRKFAARRGRGTINVDSVLNPPPFGGSRADAAAAAMKDVRFMIEGVCGKYKTAAPPAFPR